MKLLKQLLEMTLNADTEPDLSDSFPYVKDEINKNGKDVGSFNGLNYKKLIFNGTDIFGIYDNDEMVGYIQLSLETYANLSFYVLHTMYVLPQIQNRGIMTKTLWFIKNQEKRSIMSYGVVSNKSLGLYNSLQKSGRFDVKWFNIKSGEKTEFTIDDTEKLSNYGMTDWRVIIECDEYALDMRLNGKHLLSGKWKLFENVGH